MQDLVDLILKPDDERVIREVENWNAETDLDTVKEFKKLVFCGVWHDFDPKKWKGRALVSAFEKYIGEVKPEKRVVILENFRKVKTRDSLEEALTWDGEVGGMNFEAQQQAVPVVSGDLTTNEITRKLMEMGFGAEEVATFFILQNTWAPADYKVNLQGKIQFFNRECGANFVVDDSFEHTLERVNKQAEKMCGIKEIFDVKTSVTKLSVDELKWLCYPPDKNGKILVKIMYYYLQARDSCLLERICEQVEMGKKPFVVYGLNHLIRLIPALEAYDDDMM